MSTEEFYNQEFSVPPDEHPMLRIIEFYNRQLAPADIEVSLNEFLESNDGLTDDEIYALSNLELHGYYAIGVHFGWAGIQRIK